jgi:3-deoxy-D-manno-octulosonate 8-phosphate phosphatase (KDO 8-P phosphatase)
MTAASTLADRLYRTRLLALDFDGVLTDGRLHLHESGDLTKAVSYLDIVGITRWRRLGHGLCIITGDSASTIPARYAEAFKVPTLYTGRMDKLDALHEAAEELRTSLDRVIYMGDDVMDLPAMTAAAVGATVPTAHPHVTAHADWISTQPAGAGSVRELVDLTLSVQGHNITDLRPRHPQPSD